MPRTYTDGTLLNSIFLSNSLPSNKEIYPGKNLPRQGDSQSLKGYMKQPSDLSLCSWIELGELVLHCPKRNILFKQVRFFSDLKNLQRQRKSQVILIILLLNLKLIAINIRKCVFYISYASNVRNTWQLKYCLKPFFIG